MRLEKVLQAVLPMAGLLQSGAATKAAEDDTGGDAVDESAELMPSIPAVDYKDVFNMVDRRGNGAILFEEFNHSMKIYGLYPAAFSETRVLYQFAQADAHKHNEPLGMLTLEQFTDCINRVKKHSCYAVLCNGGFDLGTLGRKSGGGLICLVMLFVLIFMGVVGFATTGSFAASVNAGLPVICGRVADMLGDAGDPMELAANLAKVLPADPSELLGNIF